MCKIGKVKMTMARKVCTVVYWKTQTNGTKRRKHGGFAHGTNIAIQEYNK